MDAQYDLRVLRPLANYLREVYGPVVLQRVAAAADLTAQHLDGKSRWVSAAQFEAILAEARAQMPDDDAFKRGCVFRLAEAYGPIRYVLWATSPASVLRAAAKTLHLVTTNGAIQILESTPVSMKARFVPTAQFSRLACLVRQAQTAAFPTLWGLPPAHFHEESCAGLGDEACVYSVRWLDAKRALPMGFGLAMGLVVVFVLSRLHLLERGAQFTLPALGLLLGYAYEQHRTQKNNFAVTEEINGAVRQLAEQEAEARKEILALNQRQREWTKMLEQDTAERTDAFQQVIEKLQTLQQAREVTIRGFSHDLRNPLAVLQANIDYLRENVQSLGPEGRAIVDDFEQVIGQMRRLLDELMSVATKKTTFMQLAPAPVEVAALTERLRRRMSALVLGRDIRVSVFRTREAPDVIVTDQLLFDRVLDNILTNAAKYTERGSIVLEIDGTPDTLIIKVSDTGIGIAPEQLEKSFRSNYPVKRAKDSYGVGLSVVVQLLGQVGGKLDVMSKPNHGTTFWLHFPRDGMHPPRAVEAPPRGENRDDVVDRVVTIRKVKSA
jgi:signal transduction histidine kinase